MSLSVPPASLRLMEYDANSWTMVEHRYRNNGGTVCLLLLFTLGWGFFCYMATGTIWATFSRSESVFSAVVIIFIPILYGLTFICLYFFFWALGGRTRFRKQPEALSITYRHLWFSRTVTIRKEKIKRVLQRAYHQNNSTRILQRDLYLELKHGWSKSLLWNEKEEDIDWLASQIANWAEVEYQTEKVEMTSGAG